MESFLHILWQQIVSTVSNGHFQMILVLIAIIYSRERDRLKSATRIVDDMRQLNDEWEAFVSELKKSHAAEKQQMIRAFDEQIRAIRDAEEIIWVKVDVAAESREDSFEVSKRKPKH